ncbi:MAG: hypothetical protein HYX27_05170 [Acidobacteria bacterium]|nr:hypothetical protein [Acidobacteriota bacterium]
MSSDYVDKICGLGGQANKFERFVRLLATERWPGVVSQSLDQDGLFDVQVEHRGKVTAQIECKAKTFPPGTSEAVRSNYLTSQQIETLKARLKRCDAGERFLALTADVPSGKWSAPSGLAHLTFWGANEMAAMAKRSPVAKAFLGLTPDKIILDHDLSYIVATSGPWFRRLPIGEVIANADKERQEIFIEQSRSVLVYGPPRIGKTCSAVRQAWQWLELHKNGRTIDQPPPHVFLLNASRDEPELVSGLAPRVELPSLFVIDDIHFAGDRIKEWVAHIASVKEANPATRVIWIARDEGVHSKLGSPRPDLCRFDITKTLDLFKRKLSAARKPHLIVTVLETGLDPGIVSDLPVSGACQRL